MSRSAPENARDDALDARLRALGTRSPKCSFLCCDETDPFALTGVHPGILCREHDADRHGRQWIEEHHPAGKSNDPCTVPIPANDHAVLSANQALWPRETLRNPDGSPLLRLAAAIRGWLEILRLIIERAIAWAPAYLGDLDKRLRAVHGDEWWRQSEFQP